MLKGKGIYNMTCKIKIKMDNSAFEFPEEELSRILKILADKAQTGILRKNNSVSIMDINGNNVGKAEIK